MNLLFTPHGWADYHLWQENDKKTRKRINDLLKDISRNGALVGIGMPEALSGNLKGYFSRRIDKENRLVYTIRGDDVVVLSCRYHYGDK